MLYWELITSLGVFKLVFVLYRLATELTLDQPSAAVKGHVTPQLIPAHLLPTAVWTFHLRMRTHLHMSLQKST